MDKPRNDGRFGRDTPAERFRSRCSGSRGSRSPGASPRPVKRPVWARGSPDTVCGSARPRPWPAPISPWRPSWKTVAGSPPGCRPATPATQPPAQSAMAKLYGQNSAVKHAGASSGRPQRRYNADPSVAEGTLPARLSSQRSATCTISKIRTPDQSRSSIRLFFLKTSI